MKCEKCGNHAESSIGVKVTEFDGKQLCTYCLVPYATIKYSTVDVKWWSRN